MHQQDGKTEVLEQPVEFRTLSAKYTKFATDFVLERAKTDEPFFLYVCPESYDIWSFPNLATSKSRQ